MTKRRVLALLVTMALATGALIAQNNPPAYVTEPQYINSFYALTPNGNFIDLEYKQQCPVGICQWRSAGFAPLPPVEMTGWLSQVQALFTRLEKNDALRDDVKRIEIDVLAIVPALEKLAGEAGVSLVEGLDPKHLLQQIQDRLKTNHFH